MRRLARALWRPWLLHACGIAAVLTVGFNLHRIKIGTSDPEAHPAWSDGTPSVAAVIVSRAGLEAEARRPPPFSRRDWGLAWTNTIEQEIGPCRVLDVARLAQEPLDRYGLLVLTRGAEGKLDPDARARLAAWVQEGGGLIAELPGPELARLTGLRDEGPLGEARPWRPLAAAPRFLAARPGLERLPLWTRLPTSPPIAAEGARPETLATLEGAPAILARPLGDGLVVTVRFDFGLFLVATQQGRPEEDYSVGNRFSQYLSPELKTADMIADEAFRDNDVPVADLLERALVGAVRAHVFVPALAWWPDGAAGVYLLTHDDEERGARAEWMPDDELARGVPSTIFYISTPLGHPGPDRDSAAKLAAQGEAIGVHWVHKLGRYDPRRVVGLPRLGPFLKRVNLPEQAAQVSAALPRGARPVRLCRTHYLMWDTRWERPFAQLAAAGIQLDSSYGPDWNCKGYLFGTGYPFHPLDARGLPFALWELPYEHSEMEAGSGPQWLAGLAERSREGDHAAIVSLFHPPFFSFAPSADTYRFWRAAPAAMAAAGHPALSLEQVRRFVAAREATELCRVRLGPGRWRVDYSVPPDAAGLALAPLPPPWRAPAGPPRELRGSGSITVEAAPAPAAARAAPR